MIVPADSYFAFVMVAAVYLISPGPGTAYLVSVCTTTSFRLSILAALGLSASAALLITIIGLILRSLSDIPIEYMILLQVVGATYLGYLGVQIVSAAAKPVEPNKPKHRKISVFLESFFVGLSNPKEILFLLSLFSHFLAFDGKVGLGFLELASTWILLDISIGFLMVMVARYYFTTLKKRNSLRLLNLFLGLFLIGYSLLVVFNLWI